VIAFRVFRGTHFERILINVWYAFPKETRRIITVVQIIRKPIVAEMPFVDPPVLFADFGFAVTAFKIDVVMSAFVFFDALSALVGPPCILVNSYCLDMVFFVPCEDVATIDPFDESICKHRWRDAVVTIRLCAQFLSEFIHSFETAFPAADVLVFSESTTTFLLRIMVPHDDEHGKHDASE